MRRRLSALWMVINRPASMNSAGSRSTPVSAHHECCLLNSGSPELLQLLPHAYACKRALSCKVRSRDDVYVG
jgi:hypothetical protein